MAKIVQPHLLYEAEEMQKTIKQEAALVCDHLAKIIKSSSTVRMLIPENESGEITVEVVVPPVVEETIRMYNKRWTDMVNKFNKKYGTYNGQGFYHPGDYETRIGQ